MKHKKNKIKWNGPAANSKKRPMNKGIDNTEKELQQLMLQEQELEEYIESVQAEV